MIQDEIAKNTSDANALTQQANALTQQANDLIRQASLFTHQAHTLIPKNNLLSERLAMIESGESKQLVAEDKGSKGMGKKKLRSASF